MLPADGEAARRVGPGDGEGLFGRPARGRHAAAGGGGGGRRGRGGHGGGGPGVDGEAVEDGMVRWVITEAFPLGGNRWRWVHAGAGSAAG